MIDQAQYMQLRVDDQIAWYEKKSRENKNWYRRLRTLSITISLSIPILTGFIGKDVGINNGVKLAIAIAGASVALIEGILSLNKYLDLWTTYRTTSEGLKYHKYLFEVGAAPYDKENAYQLFVQSSEGMMASERSNWLQSALKSSPGKGDKESGDKEHAS